MKTIKFEIGAENSPVIENIKDVENLDNSLFSEQYKFMFRSLNEYFKSLSSQKESGNDKDYVVGDVDTINNIFAFLGDRGSGKTSCMLSLAKVLEDDISFKEYVYLEKINFYTLRLVDPLFFDTDHNILSLVLAELYNQFAKEKNKLEKANKNYDEGKCRELVKKFHDTQRDLTYLLKKHDYDEDNLRELSMLAASSTLKKDIGDLIKCFFSFIGKTDATLLIMVDDIDLNTREADKMVEQIRKYFIQENIVVLISLKLEQLTEIKKLSYVNEYNSLLQNKEMDYSDINEMAERYIEKLIPRNQRCYMPDATYYNNAPLIIVRDGKEDKYASVRQAVVELIYRKTRYLFYNSKTSTNRIVPNNLRELRQLISLLYVMEDYPHDSIDINTDKSYNRKLFKKYFLNSWIYARLENKDINYVDEILSVSDISSFNSTVVKILNEKYKTFISGLEDDSTKSQKERHQIVELREIVNVQNNKYNISLGDVLSLVEWLENKMLYSNDLDFLFAIKVIYSIKLYETFKQSINNDVRPEETKEILKIDENRGLDEYECFVAGKFSNSRIINILPYKQAKYSRTDKAINLDVFNKKLEHCLDHWEDALEDSNKIKLIEFFMLCISRNFSMRHPRDNYDYDFRRKQEVFFDDKINSNRVNMCFDLNSFFFNVTRIEESYKRFPRGDEFFRKINETDGEKSLWGLFKDFTINKMHYDKEVDNDTINKDFKSLCAFRNVEIIQNLYRCLSDANYSGSDDVIIIKSWFKKISDYKIAVYDKDNEAYNIVDFDYLKVIVDFFDSLNDEDKKAFSSIYDGAVYIDVEEIIKLKGKESIKKETIINKIGEKYPTYKSNEYLKNRVQSAFDKYGDDIERNQAKEAIDALNNM